MTSHWFVSTNINIKRTSDWLETDDLYRLVSKLRAHMISGNRERCKVFCLHGELANPSHECHELTLCGNGDFQLSPKVAFAQFFHLRLDIMVERGKQNHQPQNITSLL